MLQYMLCLLVFCRSHMGPVHPHPEVITRSGRLRGTVMLSREGRQFVAFRGIPFAKPPIGELRFRDPVPIQKWKGVRDATHPGKECVQWNYLQGGPTKGSEDCLYLSVFTPAVRLKPKEEFFEGWNKWPKYKWRKSLAVRSMLPVLVYIHGGCFEFGDGEAVGEGPEYYMDEPVILVKINYRLGALGFLSFEDEELPGNYGLKDQAMALKWIKNNIAYFGGDSARITITGDNAGGASVHFHLLSPLSKGLFHQAVISSGSGYSPWALAKHGRARVTAIKTAEMLGCGYGSTKEIGHCLRKKDPYQIADQRRDLITKYIDPICLYVPVIDSHAKNPFLPHALHKLKPAEVDVMFGITSDDGLLKTAFYTEHGTLDWALIDYFFSYYFKNVVLLQPERSGIEKEIKKIRNFYFGYEPLSDYNYPSLTNLFTDGWFFIPMVEAFKNHTQHVYLYYLDYLGHNSYADIFSSKRVVEGACHGDEAIYLLNMTDNHNFQPLSGKDLSFSKQLIKVWTDFARFGNPVKSKFLKLDDWRHRDYLDMSPSGFSVKKDLLVDVIQFWSKLNIMK